MIIYIYYQTNNFKVISINKLQMLNKYRSAIKIVKLGMLKLSYRFQTLQDYSCGNYLTFRKRSNSINITKISVCAF